MVAALGPVGVHVPLETRGGGRGALGRWGGKQLFSNFCIGTHTRLYFLNCKHCVFWSLGVGWTLCIAFWKT